MSGHRCALRNWKLIAQGGTLVETVPVLLPNVARHVPDVIINFYASRVTSTRDNSLTFLRTSIAAAVTATSRPFDTRTFNSIVTFIDRARRLLEERLALRRY